jgi:N-acetyl-anhydromuramyl-L-alanine amidase AmpD
MAYVTRTVVLSLIVCAAFWCSVLVLGVSDPATPAQTRQYRLDQDKLSKPRSGRPVEYIMIHFCSDVGENPTAPYSMERIACIFYKNGLSCHYMIDREGRAYLMIDEGRAAFHAGKGKLPDAPHLENSMNDVSIGIELMAIGSMREMMPFISPSLYARINRHDIGFTEAQYETLRNLVKDIRSRWPRIENTRRSIVGHSEYAVGRRRDPGELFDWARLGLAIDYKR